MDEQIKKALVKRCKNQEKSLQSELLADIDEESEDVE